MNRVRLHTTKELISTFTNISIKLHLKSSQLISLMITTQNVNKMKLKYPNYENTKSITKDFYITDEVLETLNRLSGFPEKNRTKYICRLIMSYDGFFIK